MIEGKDAGKIPFKPFHRIRELAKWKDVNPKTVRRWCKLNLIDHVHDIGGIRIPHDEFVRVVLHGISHPAPKGTGKDRLG